MKKTLLLTTALIGTLSVLSSAQAELKIGAGVKTAWKSMDGLTAGAPARSGFSQERQIDLSTSGTLNNGLKYAAGFSLEQDGGETGFDGSEGNYVNVSMGNTTIQLGDDSAPLNGDYNIVPRAGNAMNEEVGGVISFSQSAGTIKESAGIAVLQKFDGGAVAINFVPRYGQSMETADTAIAAASNSKSAYEISYAGKPVSNLDVYLGYASATKDNSDVQDLKTTSIGAAYTMGNVKVGFEKVSYDLLTGVDQTMLEIGAVMKLSDNVTAGIGKTKSEVTNTSGVDTGIDEKITYLQIGYNLGAIGTQLSYVDIDNANNQNAQDAKAVVLKVNTKF